MNEPLLASLHIPKTAGSTLLHIFEAKCGDRLQRAYQPPQLGIAKTETDGWPDIVNPACIHGHAVIERFGEMLKARPEARWMTFLREPLAGAVSLYHYRQRYKAWSPQGSKPEQNDNLETFLIHFYNHNRYCQWFSRAEKDFSDFFFVGVVEQFEVSMLLLCDALSWSPVRYKKMNAGDYNIPIISPAVTSRFKELNGDDYALYHQAQVNVQKRADNRGHKSPTASQQRCTRPPTAYSSGAG